MRLTAIVGMGQQVPVDTPARAIRCRICAAAERDHQLTASGQRAGR